MPIPSRQSPIGLFLLVVVSSFFPIYPPKHNYHSYLGGFYTRAGDVLYGDRILTEAENVRVPSIGRPGEPRVDRLASKEYRFSDVRLQKIYENPPVPTLPRGYWANRQHRHDPPADPLLT